MADAPGAEHQVIVGAVGKPFGIRGEVYVFADPDIGDEFEIGRGYDPDRGGSLVVAASRDHNGRRVVRFEGVADRTQAEALRGIVLRMPRARAVLAADAVWTDELLGRDVVDDDGAVVGVVEGVLDGTAHDFLVLARPDGGETLIPAVEALLDVSGEEIVVHAIPGLLE
ncbi:ribosome maturation factor RimM [soil metagenome]